MTSPLAGPVLVLLDHHQDAVRAPVLELLTAARALGAPVHGVWLGDGLAGALPALGRAGLARVFHVASGGAPGTLTPVAAEAITAVATEQRVALVLVTSTFENKEIAARLGAATGAGVVVDAGGVTFEGGRVVADKTVFAGTWLTRCAIGTPLAVVALKANSVHAEAAEVATTPEVVAMDVAASDLARAVTVVERIQRPASGRPRPQY